MKNCKNQSVFILSVVIAMVIIFYGVFFSDHLVFFSGMVMSWVSNTFGWLYIAYVFFLCIFLVWLAFSKYG